MPITPYTRTSQKARAGGLDSPLNLIKIYIQIRAIESVPAIRTGDLAIALDHLVPAAVADIFTLGTLSLFAFGIGVGG